MVVLILVLLDKVMNLNLCDLLEFFLVVILVFRIFL